jgi:hypothetical protein
VIHAGDLGDDGVALSSAAHEKERDAFTGCPSDCLVGQGEAASGHDDRVQADETLSLPPTVPLESQIDETLMVPSARTLLTAQTCGAPIGWLPDTWYPQTSRVLPGD